MVRDRLPADVLGDVNVPAETDASGDAEVAAAVRIALMASCSIATLVAMALPPAFQRLGADPASARDRWPR